MNRYIKISAALAAFALLLVVMGLSTQNSVNAQTGTITVAPKYVCSLPACVIAGTHDSVVTIESGTGTFKVTNLDVATVPNGINPRTITYDAATTILIVQEFTDTQVGTGTEGDGIPDNDNEVRGFNGNRIQIEYRPANSQTFATFATITVDNVKPALVINAPAEPLVVKGSTYITFSADITDGGSGYTATNTATSGMHMLTGTPGVLAPDTPASGTTMPGGVRLVVAGNVVRLDNTNFSAIDGGWNVWATIDSSSIQSIGANTPWYFETKDRAGNTRRTSGSIELNPSAVTDTTIVDGRFADNLQTETFGQSQIKVTRGSKSVNLDISDFTNGSLQGETGGTFTVDGGAVSDNPFEEDPQTGISEDDKFELIRTSLITVDSVAPRHVSATTGIAYNATAKGPVRGLKAKANSILVSFADDGKTAQTQTVTGDGAGSGLDASSVTPGAFTVSNNSVSSVFVSGNDVYLTLADKLDPDEQPSVIIASGQIKDKAGNAYGGTRISKAGDGLGPNLSLAKNSDLSDEKVTVTITTDEQLSSLPTVTVSRVVNSDGSLVGFGAMVCQATAEGNALLLDVDVSELAENAECSEDPEIAQTFFGTVVPDPRGPVGSAPSPSQTGAQAYTYAVNTSSAPASGGKFNVYAEGVDTQNPTDNKSKVGNKSGANNVGAFTFQLDPQLNGNDDPIVKVGEATAAKGDEDVPEVEAIDNLIVTVDFKGESGEYPGDSYRTVDLTSASLKITFKDGTSETTTFNLTTDVNSPDKIQFTVALLNPKVGSYSLTVKATDSAGNKSGTAGHVSRWEVVSAKPVKINLQPGWNMISLPFQPGNPAINSVIPSTHPADIVMTFDGPTQTWLVSRRDAESGLFVGDIAVMTASTAYFVRTTNFQALSVLRPPIATNAAPPPQIPALAVVKGWNLVPIVSNDSPLPDEIPADEYFGTLSNSGNAGWLKAITFNTLARSWEDVTPGEKVAVLDADGEPTFDSDGDAILEPVTVKRGKGYWLYATGDGVIIP